MKKILVATVLVAFSFALNAQSQASNSTAGASGLNIGAGFVHNFYLLDNATSSSTYGSTMDNSCYFGPYVELGYDFCPGQMNGAYIGARYEFVHHYSGVGASTIIGPWYGEAYTYRHYIDIPVKYRFACNLDMVNKFFFDLGPTFNFLMGSFSYANTYGQKAWTSTKIDWFKDFPGYYNWFNVSLGVNIGFILALHNKLFIGYDYGGLMSFTNVDYVGRGQVHQLRVGYSFMF